MRHPGNFSWKFYRAQRAVVGQLPFPAIRLSGRYQPTDKLLASCCWPASTRAAAATCGGSCRQVTSCPPGHPAAWAARCNRTPQQHKDRHSWRREPPSPRLSLRLIIELVYVLVLLHSLLRLDAPSGVGRHAHQDQYACARKASERLPHGPTRSAHALPSSGQHQALPCKTQAPRAGTLREPEFTGQACSGPST